MRSSFDSSTMLVTSSVAFFNGQKFVELPAELYWDADERKVHPYICNFIDVLEEFEEFDELEVGPKSRTIEFMFENQDSNRFKGFDIERDVIRNSVWTKTYVRHMLDFPALLLNAYEELHKEGDKKFNDCTIRIEDHEDKYVVIFR